MGYLHTFPLAVEAFAKALGRPSHSPSSPACGGGPRWGKRGFSAMRAGAAEAERSPTLPSPASRGGFRKGLAIGRAAGWLASALCLTLALSGCLPRFIGLRSSRSDIAAETRKEH